MTFQTYKWEGREATARCQEKVSHNCHQSGKIMISQCFDMKESLERLFRLNDPSNILTISLPSDAGTSWYTYYVVWIITQCVMWSGVTCDVSSWGWVGVEMLLEMHFIWTKQGRECTEISLSSVCTHCVPQCDWVAPPHVGLTDEHPAHQAATGRKVQDCEYWATFYTYLVYCTGVE